MIIKATYNRIFKQINKVFPASRADYFFIPFIISVFIFCLILTLKESRLSEPFYSISFSSTVDEIEKRKEGYYYKIDMHWYLINNPIINFISVGDSILKKPESFHIKIKDANRIKWDDVVNKNINFKVKSK